MFYDAACFLKKKLDSLHARLNSHKEALSYKKYRNGDRKIMQSIRITRIRKWNQLNKFRLTSTKVIPIEKT